MKLNRKIMIIAAAIVLAGIGITVPLMCRSSSKSVKIAFHNIPKEQEEIVRELFTRAAKQNPETEYKFLVLKQDADIISQLKKADIVFTQMGLGADKIVESIPEKNRKAVYFDSEIIAGTSMSAAEFTMQTKNSGEKKVSQIPLVFDGYEMLLSIRALSETKTESVSSWIDVENLAAKAKSVPSGIAFAGGDADSLLGTISAIIEAFDGKTKYNELIEKIGSSEEPVQVLLEKLLKENDAFNDAMHRILSWKKKGILNIQMLKKNKDEFIEILESYRSAVVIMPLSETRKLSPDTTKYMTTLPIHTNENNFYFPSIRPLNTRAVMSSALAMISMSKESYAKDAVSFMLETEAQERLCFGTGLAPLLANSRIPDIQSDDLRFWIAATSVPAVTMGLAAFDDAKRKEDFAEAIRNWIRSN